MRAHPLFTRTGWGALPPAPGLHPHAVDRITVHHTAVALDKRPTAERLRAYQRHHQQRGWPDIAYHLIVGGDGLLYEGRDPGARGDSATSYDANGHLSVAVDGDFTAAPLGDDQLAALISALVWASAEYGVEPRTIRGHSDYAPTVCPGDRLSAIIEDGSLAALVRRRIASRD